MPSKLGLGQLSIRVGETSKLGLGCLLNKGWGNFLLGSGLLPNRVNVYGSNIFVSANG